LRSAPGETAATLLNSGAYLFTVRPRPGSRACTFEYTGTFAHREGNWVASPPELVRTALQAGE
jgi:hypothetical protein